MIIRVKGGKSGIGLYLVNGAKDGRSYHRDELDQRDILNGHIAHLDNILSSFDKKNEHQKYLHITLSFKEENISRETLQQIDNEFKQFVFSAAIEDEFYYYSEIHWPKMKKARDKQGAEYERFPHIHVIVPQYNLYTGKRDNPLSRVEAINDYIDAFQEVINEKYDLASPKDNLRTLSVGRAEILNRYEIKPDMSRQEIKQRIFDLVREHREITSVDELAKVLAPLGKVRVRDSRSFGGKYINLSFDESGQRKAINLKDKVFLDDYLRNRDKDESREFRQVEKYESLVSDWKAYKAVEARFVEKVSEKERRFYYGLDHDEKLKWLEARWQLHSDMILDIAQAYENDYRDEIETKVTNKKFQLFNQIKTLDDLESIDDFNTIDEIPTLDMENGNDEERERASADGLERTEKARSAHTLPNLPQRGSNGSGRAGGFFVEKDLLQGNVRDNVERDDTADYKDLHILQDGDIERIKQEIRQRQEQPTLTDKINTTDGRALLDYVSYHYQVDTKGVKIGRSKDGFERIVKDGRSYSAADYLTKVINLKWPEAKKVLAEIWERQEGRAYRNRAVISAMLWHNFARAEENMPTLPMLRQHYRLAKHKIYTGYKYEYDPKYSRAQNAAKRRLLKQHREAELEKARNDYFAKQAYYRKRPHERYLEWLFEEAKKESKAALWELNRVYPYFDVEEKDAFTIQINEGRRPLRRFSAMNLGYEIKIKRNGAVDYYKEDKKLITDGYTAVKVYDKSAETILQALEIAKARFGVDAYEIRNASKEDIAKIQAAVNKTKVRVKVIPREQNSR